MRKEIKDAKEKENEDNDQESSLCNITYFWNIMF